MNLKSLSSPKRDLAWPAVVILAAFALWETWFFMGLSGSGWRMGLATALVTAWYVFCFVMVLASGRPAAWRRILLVTIALFFAASFMADLVESRGTVFLDQGTVLNNEIPYCHIVTPMTLIPLLLQQGLVFPARLGGHYASLYSMLAIWLVATLVLGRGWCAWVCFYGGWDDGFSRLAKKPRIELSRAPDSLRYFSFVMLGFVVLASMVSLSAVYCEWLCPFKLVTEFPQVRDFLSLLAMAMFLVGFVGLVVVMPLLSRKRFQCTAFCPFGAFQSLLDRFSLYRIAIDPGRCNGCLSCVRTCPTLSMKAETITRGSGRPLITCTKCGECVDACPRSACSYRFRPGRGGRLPLIGALGARLPGLVRTTLDSLLSPRALFVTSAYLMGMVISGGFAQSTAQRVVNWLLTGHFTRLVGGGS